MFNLFSFFTVLAASIFDQFEPMNFFKSFTIVGAGMLGIFIVIGIIILSVIILNAITKKKNKSKNDKQD